MEEKKTLLVVGLGNKGEEYKRTRHNLGALVVQAQARKWGVPLIREAKLKSQIAIFAEAEIQAILALPKTYMNESGSPVKRCVDRFAVKPQDTLIVVDDADLPLGQFRFRKGGTSGGHKGLESITEYLRTSDYQRLRIGIGRPADGKTLAEFVLETFTIEEQEELESIQQTGTELITLWLKGDYEKLNYRASQTRGENA